MKLLFIRHAIAEDRETYSLKGHPDSLRPLTRKGKKQFKKMVQWLKDKEPKIDRVWASPLVRAQETTEILKKGYPQIKVYEKKELEPQSSIAILIHALNELPEDFKNHPNSRLALVGHEPHLSQAIGSLISVAQGASLEFKKAGMARIDLESIEKGQGELKWLVTPKLVLKR